MKGLRIDYEPCLMAKCDHCEARLPELNRALTVHLFIPIPHDQCHAAITALLKMDKCHATFAAPAGEHQCWSCGIRLGRRHSMGGTMPPLEIWKINPG